MAHWITESNYFESAKLREKEGWWWYDSDRNKLTPNDKVIVYQPGNTKTAIRDGKKIAGKHKNKFIGNFTIDEIFPDENDLTFVENIIIWNEKEFVDIYGIKKELEFLSKYQDNIGWAFWNKTWIPISRHDYNLILSKK